MESKSELVAKRHALEVERKRLLNEIIENPAVSQYLKNTLQAGNATIVLHAIQKDAFISEPQLAARATPSFFNLIRDVFIRFFRSIGFIKPNTPTSQEIASLLLLVKLELEVKNTVRDEGGPEASPQRKPTLEASPQGKPTLEASPQGKPTLEASPQVKPVLETSNEPQKLKDMLASSLSARRGMQYYKDSDNESDSDDDELSQDELSQDVPPEKISAPKQSANFDKVKLIEGYMKPTAYDPNTVYIRILTKTIDFHLGRSEKEKISMHPADVVTYLGTSIPNENKEVFFEKKLPLIVNMIKEQQLIIQTKIKNESEIRAQKRADVLESIEKTPSNSPSIAQLLKSASSSASVSRGSSPTLSTSSDSIQNSPVDDAPREKNKKSSLKDKAVEYVIIHIKDNGCKFVKLADEASLKSPDVMGPIMNQYAGRVIALVGDKLFDVAKNTSGRSISYKPKEIPVLEVEGHLTALETLKNKINTLTLGEPQDAKDDLNLVIEVITGKTVVIPKVQKEDTPDVNKKILGENEKTLLSPDDIKTIRGALIFCKAPQSNEGPALLKTELSISMLETQSPEEISAELNTLYPQIEEKLKQSLNPRENDALQKLRDALHRCYPATPAVAQITPEEAPVSSAAIRRPPIGLPKDFLSQIRKEHKDESSSPSPGKGGNSEM